MARRDPTTTGAPATVAARMSQLGKLSIAKRSPADRARVARMGGIAAQRAGTAHQWTPAEAAAAGRLGGLARAARRA